MGSSKGSLSEGLYSVKMGRAQLSKDLNKTLANEQDQEESNSLI